MFRTFLLLTLIFATLTLTCSDKPAPTRPWCITGPNVSFTVRVTDTAGHPVPNLQVSIWNKYSLDLHGADTLPPRLGPILSDSTVLRYDVAHPAEFSLMHMDLADRWETGMTGSVDPGTYLVTLGSDGAKGGVVKWKLTLNPSSTNETPFIDSIFAVSFCFRPTPPVAGYTSREGTFTEIDPLSFPHLFNLPPIRHTTALSPEGRETFGYTDQVIVDAIDTATGEWMSGSTRLTFGFLKNGVSFVWRPHPKPPDLTVEQAQAMRQYLLTGDTASGGSKIEPSSQADTPQRDSLRQNYPNPF
jgi:hypothetical protein